MLAKLLAYHLQLMYQITILPVLSKIRRRCCDAKATINCNAHDVHSNHMSTLCAFLKPTYPCQDVLLDTVAVSQENAEMVRGIHLWNHAIAISVGMVRVSIN